MENKVFSLVLKNVRITFPSLWKKTQYDTKSPLKYEASFLLDPEDEAHAKHMKDLELLIVECAKHYNMGNNYLRRFFKQPKKKYEGYDGNWVVRASSKVRPKVVDRKLNPITEDDEIIYPGCRVNACMHIWGTHEGSDIAADLKTVQFFKDDERFSGSVAVEPEEVFEVYEDDGGDLI